MSTVLGVDADGAELREGDTVRHDFGATGRITGVILAPADSGLVDKFSIEWDCDPSKAPAPTASRQHVRKVAAAPRIPGGRVGKKHTGAEFESGAVHRARGLNDAEMERMREREREPFSPPRAAAGDNADVPYALRLRLHV